MKKNNILLCAVVLVTAYLFIAARILTGGIHGIISPADAATKIWAINGKDSVLAKLSPGSFAVDVKPGTWKLYVAAAKGYKSIIIDNIIVDPDRYTDAGEIKLTAE